MASCIDFKSDNLALLGSITNFVADLIWKLDEAPAGIQPQADDSVDFEVRMIKKA